MYTRVYYMYTRVCIYIYIYIPILALLGLVQDIVLEHHERVLRASIGMISITASSINICV